MTIEDVRTKLTATIADIVVVCDTETVEGFTSHRNLGKLQLLFPQVTYKFVEQRHHEKLAYYGISNPIRFKISMRGLLDPPEEEQRGLQYHATSGAPIVEIDQMEEAIFSPDAVVKISIGRLEDDNTRAYALITGEAAQGRAVATEKFAIEV